MTGGRPWEAVSVWREVDASNIGLEVVEKVFGNRKLASLATLTNLEYQSITVHHHLRDRWE